MYLRLRFRKQVENTQRMFFHVFGNGQRGYNRAYVHYACMMMGMVAMVVVMAVVMAVAVMVAM